MLLLVLLLMLVLLFYKVVEFYRIFSFNLTVPSELSVSSITPLSCLHNPIASGRCDTRIDTIFSHAGDGKTYVFRGDRYWRISYGYKADEGYPQPIESKWHGLPSNIDVALLWGYNWKTYFFKVSLYFILHPST